MAEMAPLTSTSNATAATVTASLDRFLKSALATEDPSISIKLSLEHILDYSSLQSEKESLIDGATEVASAFMDVVTRSARKLAAVHNSSVWPLPADLTTKVLLMLDTGSVCYAAATCSLFSKCALDPLCYANIDLTRSVAKVSNQVVSSMIRKGGKNLRSIKLGRLPQDKKTSDKSRLTWSCLSALQCDGGASGLLLRQLHLYNLETQDYYLLSALSACQSLVELEIVGLDIELDRILSTICQYCHLIERLCLDVRTINYRGSYLKASNMIKKCPLLSSLALRGYEISDELLSAIVKGACGMKSLDLSGSSGFKGAFLWYFSNGAGADSLETLILSDCKNLGAEQVSRFLSAVFSGDRKALRYVDVSNCQGLLHGWGVSTPTPRRCAIDVSQISEKRPDIHLIADYPPVLCLYP